MTPEGRTGRLLEAIASKEPAPASGSAAAAAAAMGAALLEKVALLSARQMGDDADSARGRAHAQRMRCEELIEADVHAYLAFVAARRSGDEVDVARSATVEVPIEIARAAAEIVEMGCRLADAGNPNLRADAVAAAILARSAVECAAMLVRVNLGSAAGDPRAGEARRLVRSASASVRRLTAPRREGGPDRGRARSASTPRQSPRRIARGTRSAPRTPRRAP